jgi:hypothetical protein
MMYLALSYDHRIVDGKEAVTFLVRVKENLEDPQRKWKSRHPGESQDPASGVQGWAPAFAGVTNTMESKWGE